jgi:hypothetical protein
MEISKGLRVIFNAGRTTGRLRKKLGDGACAANEVQLMLRIDALGRGDKVRRAAFAANFGDGLKDQPVRGCEEKIGVKTGDFVNKARVGEQTAEDGLLDGRRLGHSAFHENLPSSSSSLITMTMKISVHISRLKSVSSLTLIFFLPPGETRATALPAVAGCVYEAKCFFEPWCDVVFGRWWRLMLSGHDVLRLSVVA